MVDALRRNRAVVALFALMVLLPGAVSAILVVRALRGEQARLEYEKAARQRQIIEFTNADLTNWLFAAVPGGAGSQALLRFEMQGDAILFPDFELSLPADGSPQQRPFDAAPPATRLTSAVVAAQYVPRILAFRRDVAAGRNTGAQYFRQLRALVVQPPGSQAGYVAALQDVLAHVDRKLAELSATESFTARTWIAAERSSLPPAGAMTLDSFPFFAIVFEDAPAYASAGLGTRLLPYSMGLLAFVTLLASVFVYRAVANEARLARLRNDFVAAVSHEFRSPLSSIVALAERLDRLDGDPERLREYQRIIGQDARRLSALVTKLLDFAQIEDGRDVYAAERVDLAGAAREAVSACQHVAHPERIRLAGADEAPLWVRGDRTALQHAIQNVIENAAKYSPPEAPILVQCATSHGSHLVEVCDRGIGIPAAEHARIFEKFYRGRQAAGTNVHGVGVGLALVRHIIESHGGSVGVDSRPDEGSRFSLRLPRAES
jgi:signal transduction histidine kinase